MALDKDLQAAAAMADTSQLTPFEGLPVVRSTIAIIGAGDGLSQAMAVEPIEYHHGDIVHVLLECVVADVQHPPLSKDTPDVLARKHKFRAQAATVVDAEWGNKKIAAQKQRIERAKDAARGQERLTGDTDSEVNPDATAPAGGEPANVGGDVMTFPKGGKAGKKPKLDEKPARDALRALSRAHLGDLLDASSLPYTTKTVAQDRIDSLVAYAGEMGGQAGLDALAEAAVNLHGTPSDG